MYCELFLAVVERFAEVFGAPLPKKLLELGDEATGWGVKLNPTKEPIEDVAPFSANVTWNGFPAGIIDPSGGLLAAGELANEETFREWLSEVGAPL